MKYDIDGPSKLSTEILPQPTKYIVNANVTVNVSLFIPRVWRVSVLGKSWTSWACGDPTHLNSSSKTARCQVGLKGLSWVLERHRGVTWLVG